MTSRVAVIDVGTNSVLLTIAEGKGAAIEAVFEGATITRLGEGLAASGVISESAARRTLSAIQNYVAISKGRGKCPPTSPGTGEIFAIGTAALRGAKNGGEFLKRVKKACGLDIEIISGEREAELSFKSCAHDFGPDIVVIDIGGGSTEIVVGPGDIGYGPRIAPGMTNFLSLPFGCVTLHEKFIHTDPIDKTEFETLVSHVSKLFDPANLNQYPPLGWVLVAHPRGGAGLTLVATAGTATNLAAMRLWLKKYDHARVHGLRLAIEDIEEIIGTLKARTIKERKRLPGLQPERADVILPGAVILCTFMKTCGFDTVTISDRGLRWGLVYEKF